MACKVYFYRSVAAIELRRSSGQTSSFIRRPYGMVAMQKMKVSVRYAQWQSQRWNYLFVNAAYWPIANQKKIKYDVATTAHCPECNEEVNVGTAGPAGLVQHTGKSKCEKTKEMKKKQEKEGKNRIRTLFEVGIVFSWVSTYLLSPLLISHKGCSAQSWGTAVTWKQWRQRVRATRSNGGGTIRVWVRVRFHWRRIRSRELEFRE